MNTASWEVSRAARAGDNVVLSHGDEVWTGNEILRDAARLATALQSLGLHPGDRVAITLPNSYHLVVVISAVWLAGGVVVVLGDKSREELWGLLRHCEPKVVVAAEPLREPADSSAPIQLLSRADGYRGCLSIGALIEAHEPISLAVERQDADLAQLCYTSGVTGSPKAVEYSHAALNALRIARSSISPDLHTLLLAVPPTAFGSRFLCMHAASHQKYVLLDGFTPEVFLNEVESKRVTEAPIVPTMAKQLIAHSPRRRYDCSSLVQLNLSGAQVPVALVLELKRWFARHCSGARPEIFVHYGATEVGGGISRTARHEERLVGRALPGIEVRVLGDDGRDVELGGQGEIVVRSPYAGRAYWRNPRLSLSTFKDGFVHTGDVGYQNADGEVFLVGRKTDLIIQGGYNIDPCEVALAIERLSGVSECGVVGIEDDLLGEAVVACVVAEFESEISDRDILQHCRMELDSKKLPALVLFFDDLPRTETGKLKTAQLRISVLSRIARLQMKPRELDVSPRDRRRSLAALVSAMIGDIVHPLGHIGSGGPEPTFGDLGIDSIAAVQVAHSLSFNLGIAVPATVLYSQPTISSLAAWIDTRLASAAPEDRRPAAGL